VPRLVLFVPCNLTIVGADENALSVIQIMEDVNVPVDPAGAMEADASAALQWTALTLWQREPSDEGQSFEQRIQLARPDGVVGLDSIVRFELAKRNQRNILRVTGFPVGQSGICKLTLTIRAEGEVDWRPMTEYHLEVKYVGDAPDNE